MSRNVLLLGGPFNGRMERVREDQTAVTVVTMEQEIVQTLTGCQPLGGVYMQSHLYWQSETDKNVFNYAH